MKLAVSLCFQPTAEADTSVSPIIHCRWWQRRPGIVVSAHDLRRDFITAAENTDMSAYALKALVDHTLPESDVTAGYMNMTVARLREPMQRVCDQLKAWCHIDPAFCTTANLPCLFTLKLKALDLSLIKTYNSNW